MIVGESLFSVILAGVIVASGKGEPLAVVSNFEGPATLIGIALFVALVVGLYRWSRRMGEGLKAA
jgi:hypothetical protein